MCCTFPALWMRRSELQTRAESPEHRSQLHRLTAGLRSTGIGAPINGFSFFVGLSHRHRQALSLLSSCPFPSSTQQNSFLPPFLSPDPNPPGPLLLSCPDQAGHITGGLHGKTDTYGSVPCDPGATCGGSQTNLPEILFIDF